jgi:hypothetical protein
VPETNATQKRTAARRTGNTTAERREARARTPPDERSAKPERAGRAAFCAWMIPEIRLAARPESSRTPATAA